MIDLPGEQPLGWPVQLQVAVKLTFRQFPVLQVLAAADVGQQTVLFIDALNLERPALMAANSVARCKYDTRQRCALHGIGTGLTGRNEDQRDGPQFDRQHGAETQLQLGIVNPALSRNEVAHPVYRPG